VYTYIVDDGTENTTSTPPRDVNRLACDSRRILWAPNARLLTGGRGGGSSPVRRCRKTPVDSLPVSVGDPFGRVLNIAFRMDRCCTARRAANTPFRPVPNKRPMSILLNIMTDGRFEWNDVRTRTRGRTALFNNILLCCVTDKRCSCPVFIGQNVIVGRTFSWRIVVVVVVPSARRETRYIFFIWRFLAFAKRVRGDTANN